MKLFDVYPLFDITPVSASGSVITDIHGNDYIDFYGGHAVISIGHSHPHYVRRLKDQLYQLAFYSNAVKNPLQEQFAEKLGQISGYGDYQLFLCNSGAEANENAIKLASFHNGRKKIIAFGGSFHGRTSAAVAATDDAKINTLVNAQHEVIFLPLNDYEAAEKNIDDSVCAVIIEGIQGVSGIYEPENNFLQLLEKRCEASGAILILDEVQSGYGRTGKFFAHQHSTIRPHIITTAKGMGNGFPVAGVLISPQIKARHGMLGTTFGGNYLACAAAMAVLEVIEQEQLISYAQQAGNDLIKQISATEGVKEVRGKGLMIGVSLEENVSAVRKKLLHEKFIFTGSASNPDTIRLLPPLNISQAHIQQFTNAFSEVLHPLTVPLP